MRDDDGVDVACRACDLDSLARTVGVVGVAVFFDAALAIEDEHLFGVGALESLAVRLWWIVYIAARISATIHYSN
jgi:hypothetical protein